MRVAFRLDKDEPAPFLAAVYYDQFQLRGWTRSPGVQAVKDAGTDVLAGTAEDVDAEGRTSLTVTIQPAFSRREIFTPGPPTSIRRHASISLPRADT